MVSIVIDCGIEKSVSGRSHKLIMHLPLSWRRPGGVPWSCQLLVTELSTGTGWPFNQQRPSKITGRSSCCYRHRPSTVLAMSGWHANLTNRDDGLPYRHLPVRGYVQGYTTLCPTRQSQSKQGQINRLLTGTTKSSIVRQ